MGKARKGNGPKPGKAGSNKKRASQVRGDVLTPEQETFCQEYILNGRIGSKAILKARPWLIDKTDQYRAEQASKLLALSKIQARISALQERSQARALERFDISFDRIAQRLAALTFADIGDYFEFGSRQVPVLDKKGEKVIDEFGAVKMRVEKFVNLRNSKDLTALQRAGIVAVGETISRTGDKVIEVKLGDPRQAANDLARLMGYLSNTQRVEVTGKDGGPIESVQHTLPDLEGVTDPKAALRAFEEFRMSRMPSGSKH